MRELKRAIGNMIARCSVIAVNAATKLQMLQVGLLSDETKDNIEHLEPFGFTSNPPGGSEGVAIFPDGDRSHGVVIVVSNRAYRLQGLSAGEAALYDAFGHVITLKQTGIVIDAGTQSIVVKSAEKVRIESPRLECTGEVVDRCDTNGKSMRDMRTTYNTHTHNETDTVTHAPNQIM